MKCGQCGYAEARTPLQLRQHVRKRHQPKSESVPNMLQLETDSEGGVRKGKGRSKVQVRYIVRSIIEFKRCLADS